MRRYTVYVGLEGGEYVSKLNLFISVLALRAFVTSCGLNCL